MQKKKVAILGGGMSSLTTAFELTNPANDQNQGYEITVYQLGWRLGGKAASGRNMDPAYSCRIEEDGLHVFYGFYDNAFSLIQSCYHELDRAPDAPLASWEDAFKPHSYVEYYQLFLNKWRKMHVTYPRNLLTPGGDGSGGNGSLGLLESYAAPAVERIRGVYHDSAASRKEDGGSKRKVDPKVRLIVRLLYEEYQEEMVLAERAGTVGGPETLNFKGQMLASAQVLADWIASEPEALAAWVGTNSSLMADLIKVVDYSPEGELFKELGLQILCLILDEFRKLLWDVLKVGVKSSFTAYQVWVLINWGIGNVCGVIQDGLIWRGFDAVNDKDYRAWLNQYLLNDGGITFESIITTQIYASSFNYRDGKLPLMDMEAGTVLLTLLRVVLTYKGAYSWKMQAGTGDVVFAPLYLVLKKRGVKFEFFSRVKSLELSKDWERIEKIHLERQVRLKKGDYEPLVMIKGIDCWPSTPLWDQLVDGKELEQLGVDFETYADQKSGYDETLECGEQFDEVVLGISVGALKCVFPGIFKEKDSPKPEVAKKWRRMLNHMETVRTQAFQVWFKKTFYQTGNPTPPPLATGFDASPMNSYSEMPQYIPQEGWPAIGEQYPLSMGLFCGPMENLPGDDSSCNPPRGLHIAKEKALTLLRQYAGIFWPKSCPKGKSLDWSVLVDNRKVPGHGEARFDSQYWWTPPNRSNRYVRVATNSSRFRLEAGDSGVSNLYLTGDWIDNTFYVGCIEASVMSGMATSNAMSGYPLLGDIPGWGFGKPK